jgi:two-component system, cell cycle sensor histidine kinase and response regulator CckA
MKDTDKTKTKLIEELNELRASTAKAAERDHSSEDIYRTIIHTTQDGFWLVNSEGRLMDVNDAYIAMSGYTRAELVGIHIPDLDAFETETDTADRITRIIALGSDRFERVHRKKDGSTFDVEISTSFLPENGVFVTFLRDLSERNESDKRVSRQRYYLEKAQELGQIGTWELDLLQNKLYWTDENCRIFGVRPGSVVNYEVFLEIVHPSDREYVNNEWMAALGGKAYDIEHRILTNGQEDWVREKADITFDDNGTAISAVGFTQNITKRKNAVEALQRVNDLLQSGLDSMPLAYIVWDMDLNVTEWNKAAEIIFGYKREEVIGRNAVELIVPEKDRDAVSNVMKHLSAGDIMDYSERDNNVRKSGETISCRWYNRPLVTQNGDQFAILTIAEDVTTKMQMASTQADLQKKLARSERIEALGVLAGGVAHDLNNVLGPMVILPDMISEDLAKSDGKSTEDIAESLDVIRASAMRAASIVRDLVDLGRRANYDLVPVNINEHHCVAGDCADIESIRAINPGVSIVHKLAEEPLIISADESHFSRAICNLLQNGVESIESKGMVTLRTSKKSISEPLEGYETVPGGNYAIIEVSDTGAGIDEKLVGRVFEPFVTRKQNTDRSGSGLGLSVVHGIIKDHSGFIDVSSEVGKGSVFTLYLPLIDQPSADKEAPKDAAVVGGTERILVVDDELGQRFIGCKSLKRLGYEVAEAESGHQALKQFEKAKEAGAESPYDLAVLDMIMEDDLDGLKTYQAIQDLFPRQKVIICSGHAEDDRAKAARALGAGWLAKPYGVNGLSVAVRKRLDREG